MATNLATAYVPIVPSMAGIQGQLTKQLVPQVTGAAGTAGNKAGAQMNKSIGQQMKANLGKIMKGAMVGAVGVVAAAGIGKSLWGAITDAGQLEQSVGAIETVFKTSSKQMLRWSDDAAQSVGLSKNEFNELGTLIGAQLKNGGTAMEDLAPKTNELITLGADLSSMFGGTTKEAVDALSSALKGERDPIERFGVSLNQTKIDAEAAALGFEKVGGSLSAEANQAATLSLIMKQTTDAHGNFGREADTFAGKQQRMLAEWDNLKTAMGERFLPIMTNVFGFINTTALPALSNFGSFIQTDVIPRIQAFGSFLYDNKTAILSVVTVVGSMVAGFFAISGTVAAVTGAIGFATTAIATVKSALMTARIAVMLFNSALLANPIGLIVAAIAGLVAGFILAYNNIGWFKTGVDAAFSWIKVVINNVLIWFQTIAVPWFQNALTTLGIAFTWLKDYVVAPVMEAIKVIIAIVVGTILTIINGLVWTWRNVLAPVFTWLYINVVVPVMNGIKFAINAVATWISITLVPFIRSAITILGSIFRWLKDSVITPVWNGIKWVINMAWEGIKIYFNAIRWYINNVLAPVFRWLKDNVVVPVWNGIRSAIGAAWSFIRNYIFIPIRNFLRDTLGSAFNWLKDRATAAFNAIRSNLNNSWVFIRDRVFNPLKNAVQTQVVQAFEKAKDGIQTAWNKIKNVVKEPVKFVLQTVLQNGLIKNVNAVLSKVGAKTRIGDVWPVPGFHDGGRTANVGEHEVAGVVHGKEHVTRAKSLASVDRVAPGLMDGINKYGAKALHMFNPAHAAPGAFLPSYGTGSWTGGLRSAIFGSGVLNVAGSAPGYDLPGAVRMVDRATRVKVRKGSGGANTVHVRSGNMGAWWAGYQEGNTIRLNDGVAGRMALPAKRVMLAHEIGHALGLPHNARMHGGNGARSMMNYDNMYQHNSVTDADVKALSAIYGGSGFASGGGGGGGFLDWIAEKLSPVKKFLEGLTKMLSDGLGTGLLSDMVSGAVKMITGSITNWVTDKIKGSPEGKENGDAAPGIPTLFDSGGILPASANGMLVANRTKKPEGIFTNSQTKSLLGVYQAVANGELSNGGGNININGPIYTRDESELAQQMEYERRKAQKRGLL